MKCNLLLNFILIISFVSYTNLNAQVILNTTGGNTIANEGEVSFTIGQIFFYSSIGQNGSIIQGAQQPYEISVITSINDIKPIDLYVHVFPNPTEDYLILKIDDDQLNIYYYQLFDVNGKLLESEKILNVETKISMRQFVSATYIVRVLIGENTIKTYKIIKK